jgi:hypothetical protein
MSDNEFLEFRNSLSFLAGVGVFTAVFRATKEKETRKAIEDRFGEIITPKVYLCNVELLFI